MADIEEGELKEEEQTTVGKATAAQGKDSDLECQGEDKNAGKFFEFLLPTRGWAKVMATQLGLPSELGNTFLPTEPMTPITLPRNWIPQARIFIKSDGCCLLCSVGHQVWGQDSPQRDDVQLHVWSGNASKRSGWRCMGRTSSGLTG